MRATTFRRIKSYRLLLAVAALGSCGDCGKDTNTQPTGSITLSLSSTGATVQQGGSAPLTGTVTRAGGFTGTVTLTVTGAPAGVTVTNGTPQTSGTTTSAVITLTVAAGTAPGSYPLSVKGQASGVSEATAPFTLTVSPAGSFSLELAPTGGVTLQQGNADNSKTVTIARTNYTPAVTLSAEGLPTGVTASFAGNPVGGSSSLMTLTASAGAVVGAPVTVTIRGTGPASLRAGTPPVALEATVTFALTVVPVPDYTLAVNPSSLSMAQGAVRNDLAVTITRTNFTGAVTLSLGGTVPAGVTAQFAPLAPTGTSATLTLAVGAATPPGVYPLQVAGAGGPGARSTPLTLTVTSSSLAAETFRQPSVSDPSAWTAGGVGPAVNPGWPGAACLTAGTNTTQTPIPGCGLLVPDAAGAGVLRLTETTPALPTGHVGFVLYKQPLSTAGGLDITFHQAQYSVAASGIYADGMSFFLVDGTANLTQPGSGGGTLGYAPGGLVTPGVTKALLGIGLDVYGNFSTNFGIVCAGDAGPGFRPNTVTIRGPGDQFSGYCFLGTSGDLSAHGLQLHTTTTTRPDMTVRVVLDPASVAARKVTVYLNGIQVVQIPAPAALIAATTFKFGFAAATGAATDIHEVWGLTINPAAP